MKIPDIDCKIEIFGSINPSEDSSKVSSAISNIFPLCSTNIENYSVVAESSNLASLENVFETIHNKKSQKTYKRNLQKNLNKNTSWFYLNKQAAFVGKVAICEESDESPLGPFKIFITSPKIERIIDWLVSGDSELS